MDFRVLGPVEVYDAAGVRLRLGNRRTERALLGLLLLEAGHAVATDRLIELLWDCDPPAGARALLSTHASRLRRSLAAAGSEVLLRGGRDGYLLGVDPVAVDAHRFRMQMDAARGLPDPAERAGRLSAALALWRGPLLADAIDEALRARLGTGWEESRLAALEARIEADLACGRHPELVAELAALVQVHPLHEGFHGQWMQALTGTGRGPEALAAYQEMRQRLVDELGLDPGPRLRAVHDLVLRGDVPAAGADPAGDVRGPAELPAPPRPFIGRAAELAELDGMLPGAAGRPAVCLLVGPAGVGKTALALHWATAVRHRYPDGQLHVDLGGFGSAPVTPADTLTRFLRSFGLSSDQVPRDLDEAASVYRSMLADRTVLLVLDNAASAQQVRPLLPGGATASVVVTSRVRLDGLVALNGARPVPVRPLPPRQSGRLLRSMLRDRRVTGSPAELAAVCASCDHLPLALRIAAATLGAIPDRPVAAYLRQLDRDPLGTLAVSGDPDATVRIALDASYARLVPGARRLLRLLGTAPGQDITPAGMAALCDRSVPGVAPLLAELVTAHLVDEHRAGRYQLHDLVRSYAAERARAEDSAEDLDRAAERLLDRWIAVARQLAAAIAPNRTLAPPPPARTPAELPADPDPNRLMAELDVERANLPALAAAGYERGDDAAVWHFGYLLGAYFQRRGDGPDSLAVYRSGLAAAERRADTAAVVRLRNSLGIALAVCGDLPAAADELTQALRASRQAGDADAEGGVLGNLARIQQERGRWDEALVSFRASLRLREAAGRTDRRGHSLNSIGDVLVSRGDSRAALPHLRQALAAHRASGDRSGEAYTLGTLGKAYLALGDLDRAVEHLRHALVAVRESGSREAEGGTLLNLGTALVRHGDAARGTRHLIGAIRVFRQTGNRPAEETARQRLAEARRSR